MNHCALLGCIFVALGATTVPGNAVDWRLIGNDPFGSGAEIFLLADGIQDFGDGNFRAVTLTVHPMTVRGIDLPGPDGET